jgi:hypothetical protein
VFGFRLESGILRDFVTHATHHRKAHLIHRSSRSKDCDATHDSSDFESMDYDGVLTFHNQDGATQKIMRGGV